jgi:hypothetical protein
VVLAGVVPDSTWSPARAGGWGKKCVNTNKHTQDKAMPLSSPRVKLRKRVSSPRKKKSPTKKRSPRRSNSGRRVMVTRGYTQSRSPRRYRAASDGELKVTTHTEGGVTYFKVGTSSNTSIISIRDVNTIKYIFIQFITDVKHIEPLLNAVQTTYPNDVIALDSNTLDLFKNLTQPHEKAFARTLYNMQCTEPDSTEVMKKHSKKPTTIVAALKELFGYDS